MDTFFKIQFSWGEFAVVLVLLLCVWVLLRNTAPLVQRLGLPVRFQRQILRTLRLANLLFEPTALLVLTTAFMLVNPAFHGTLVLLFFVGGIRQLRDYVSSFFLRLDPALSIGNRIEIGGQKGVITALGALGLRLKTAKGLMYQNYSTLLKKGYTQLSGEAVGGFYDLHILPLQEGKTSDHLERLTDLLATSPYLDWSHRPELVPSSKKSGQLRAKVLVKEKNHLHDFLALVEAWGYECAILKK